MTIDVIDASSRLQFAQPLMEMYHDRKRVFVDQLGWQLPVAGSWLEIDQYDNEDAIYILARDRVAGKHLGSVRLLPTTAPHLLSDIFPDLCPAGPPSGVDVWEISRLVTNPDSAAGAMGVRVHRMLASALIDFALSNQVSRYTLVIEYSRLPALLAVGWTVSPISMPRRVNGDLVQALEIAIDENSIAQVRQRARAPQRCCASATDLVGAAA